MNASRLRRGALVFRRRRELRESGIERLLNALRVNTIAFLLIAQQINHRKE
jgi:hypothetical protein